MGLTYAKSSGRFQIPQTAIHRCVKHRTVCLLFFFTLLLLVKYHCCFLEYYQIKLLYLFYVQYLLHFCAHFCGILMYSIQNSKPLNTIFKAFNFSDTCSFLHNQVGMWDPWSLTCTAPCCMVGYTCIPLTRQR